MLLPAAFSRDARCGRCSASTAAQWRKPLTASRFATGGETSTRCQADDSLALRRDAPLVLPAVIMKARESHVSSLGSKREYTSYFYAADIQISRR